MSESFLPKAVEVIHVAGQMLLSAFGKVSQVDEIFEHDVKLHLDRECQELITKQLLAEFPEHTVFGEEGGADYGASEYQWIVDPIDGTVNFFYGFPHF